jgi:hypothetical protein
VGGCELTAGTCLATTSIISILSNGPLERHSYSTENCARHAASMPVSASSTPRHQRRASHGRMHGRGGTRETRESGKRRGRGEKEDKRDEELRVERAS